MVTWEFPPLVVGGLAAHVDGLSRALVRRATRSWCSRCTTPTWTTTTTSRACACSGPGPTCPGCRPRTSSPRWPPPTTVSSSSTPASTGGSPTSCTPTTGWWRGPATPFTRCYGRAPGRHGARHRARSQRRPRAARSARGDPRRRVVAHLPGQPGDRLLALHGRRDRAPGSTCPPTRSTRCPTASTPRCGRLPHRHRRAEREDRSWSRGVACSTRRASSTSSRRWPPCDGACPGSTS